MDVNNPARVIISKFFSSAGGSLILACFSVLSAGYISICSSPILEQCKALLGQNVPKPETYFHSIVALGLTLLALLMVWMRELGLSDLAKRKENALEEKRLEMLSQLTNMPPRQFTDIYADTLREIGLLRQLTKKEAQSLDYETVVKRIQTMMTSVLSLTRSWDDVSASSKSVSYHANIMQIFHSDEIAISPVLDLNLEGTNNLEDINDAKDLGGTEGHQELAEEYDANVDINKYGNDKDSIDNGNTDKKQLENWILQFEFFLHNQSYAVATERCSGILFIQDREMSVESLHPDVGDKNVEQICLPFTFETDFKYGHHQPNLPGAPEAAATSRPIYIPDFKEVIDKWFKEYKTRDREISPRYEDAVRVYYRDLRHAKSLLSLPIHHQDRLMGVLNISRSQENMLMNADRAEMFAQLMSPVCYHLGKMLASLEESNIVQGQLPANAESDDEN